MQESKGKRLKKYIGKKINIKAQVTYKAKKLVLKFHVQDEIKLSNKHDIAYAAECPTCGNKYIGQTTCRCIKRVIEHNAKDINSHLARKVNIQRCDWITLTFLVVGVVVISNGKLVKHYTLKN